MLQLIYFINFEVIPFYLNKTITFIYKSINMLYMGDYILKNLIPSYYNKLKVVGIQFCFYSYINENYFAIYLIICIWILIITLVLLIDYYEELNNIYPILTKVILVIVLVVLLVLIGLLGYIILYGPFNRGSDNAGPSNQPTTGQTDPNRPRIPGPGPDNAYYPEPYVINPNQADLDTLKTIGNKIYAQSNTNIERGFPISIYDNNWADIKPRAVIYEEDFSVLHKYLRRLNVDGSGSTYKWHATSSETTPRLSCFYKQDVILKADKHLAYHVQDAIDRLRIN